MTLFAYKLQVTIRALIWREKKMRREGFLVFSIFVLAKKKKKQIPRLKFHAASTHTNTHARPIFFSPMKARAGVQGSPRMLCPALLSCSFQCIRGGWEAPLCQKMGQALSLPASFFHPGLCLPGQLSFLSPACVYLWMCVCTYVCVCVWGRVQVKEEHEREKQARWTRCQTFSNFLSTTNLIGSSDAPTVKGEQDWMMPAGIEQAVGRTWLGMFGMRQEFGQISPYRTLSGESLCVCWCFCVVCMFRASLQVPNLY